MKRILLSIVCLCVFVYNSLGQSSVDFDEIEITVESVKLSEKGDTAIVSLVLQSYLKHPRELKVNTFASGLVSPQGKVMIYDSFTLGKVRLLARDRQNYMHYLLLRDEPVLLVIKSAGWQKRWGKPQQIRLTLEDHLEEGKFLQVDIPLSQ